jgi:hypothetical protein
MSRIAVLLAALLFLACSSPTNTNQTSTPWVPDATKDTTKVDTKDTKTGCTTDGDCVDQAGTPRCDTAAGKCVACLPDDPTSCPDGSFCDPAPEGFEDEGPACLPGCDNDQDCDEKSGTSVTCDVDQHVCSGCSQDSDCPSGLECQKDGTCRVCEPDSTSACYSGPTETRGKGICKDGTRKCIANGLAWSVCDGETLPGVEACPAPEDEDCDGLVNEPGSAGCECQPGETISCYDGPDKTAGVGACKAGTRTCEPSGLGFGPCLGMVTPKPDVCTDELDNDCNGTKNDGFKAGAAGCGCEPGFAEPCYSGSPAQIGVGECQAGVRVCSDLGAGFLPCQGEVKPTPDVCIDNLDNDCNGIINDGFEAGADGCGCTPLSVQDCYDGPIGTVNVGECKAGKAVCAEDGTAWGKCLAQTLPDTTNCMELADKDCDGLVNGPGAMKCLGNSLQTCTQEGLWNVPFDCASKSCNNAFGCVVCVPGTQECQGDVAHKCKPDGSGWVDYECDSLLGSACKDGACTGPCAPDAIDRTYVGCDYYPTVTTNSLLEANAANFAIAVSNTTANESTVTITRGKNVIASKKVAASSVELILLPWVMELKKPGNTLLLNDGAYRVRSTQPITVYQFNPLEYTAGGQYTYTNDASLLLPTTAWKSTYMVASRGVWKGYSGFYSVVAGMDNTTVTLQPTGGVSIKPGGGVPANGAAQIVMNRGAVLQVLAASGDSTGTVVTADKPVQVFGGHNCTNVPDNIVACDHLEESMFPIDTLGKDYLITAPAIPGQVQPKVNIVRIIAVEGATVLKYDPPVGGAPLNLGGAGQFLEINTADSFRITADKRILVAQYMEGQAAGGGSGDPAMTLAVPIGQNLTSYLFHAPKNYETNYVNIVGPVAAAVTLDGNVVPAFTPIGGTGYGVTRVQFPNAGNGTHSIQSPDKIGISVYGYGQYTSYWYPGGLNLADM